MNERTKELIQMADLCAAGLMASGATEEEIQNRSKVVLANLVRQDEREACAKMVEPLDESLADEIRVRGDVHASDMSEKHAQKSDKDRNKSYDPMERNADYERGFIDGRADQMKSSVDRAVNRMAQREWVGLDPEMMRNTLIEFNRGALWAERWLKEKNT